MVKSVIRHQEVKAVRFIKEINSFLSIGVEGNIFAYDANPVNEEGSFQDLFKIHQTHRLIWNHVTSIAFLSDSRIVAGNYKDFYCLNVFILRLRKWSHSVCKV